MINKLEALANIKLISMFFLGGGEWDSISQPPPSNVKKNESNIDRTLCNY